MFPSKPLWYCVVSLFVIDAIWLIQTNFSLMLASYFPVPIALILLAATAWFYTYRRPVPGFSMLAVAMIYIVLLTNSAAVYSYFITSLNLPLLDAQFATIDASLMFNWTAFLSWVNDRPALGWTLTWAYRSSILQVFVLLLALGFAQRKACLTEFLTLFTFTMLVIVTLAGLLPSEGAYAFHLPAAETFANLNQEAGMWHHQYFVGLRDGSLRTISFAKTEGLVTFPSFHTALAIITAYCFRDFRFVFPAAVLLNSVVVVSTLTEGGHYLVDVLAGAAITAFAIAGYRSLNRGSVGLSNLDFGIPGEHSVAPTIQSTSR